MKKDWLVAHKNEIPTEDEETSAFMYVLTSIYMYLFIVVLAIFIAINSMASSWEKDIMGAVTVQIIPIQDDSKHIDKIKTAEQQNKVLQYIEQLSGVESVTVLDDEAIKKLMTPWLGNKIDISSLPIPQLLDVKLKSGEELNYDEVIQGLRKITANATVDNHRLWLNKLIRFANSLKTLALFVLAMVSLICALSIYYSAKTSLNINKNSIEILHIVGAKDEYIAKQYAKIYGKIGFFAGIIALLFAVPSIIFVGKYGISTGSGLLSGAGISNLSWCAIMITPLFSLIYSTIIAFYTVRRSLEKMV